MKYSSSNKPLQCMMTQSTCYKGTRKMTVKGILVHSTGANNPNLCRYVQPDDNASNRQEMIAKLGRNSYGNDWNHTYVEAGLNAWIGKLADGTVTTVQTMPWDYRPWGCGSGVNGSCNNGWIQFEICEDGLSDKTYFNKVYQETVELCAYLCKMYNLSPGGWTTCDGTKCPVIVCHADSYSLGLGSGHADVNHWFPKHGKSMDTLRADIAKCMTESTSTTTQTESVKKLYRVRKSWDDVESQKGAYSENNLAGAKECCQKAGKGYKVFDWNGKQVYAYVAPTTTTTPTTPPTTTTKPAETTKPTTAPTQPPIKDEVEEETPKVEETPTVEDASKPSEKDEVVKEESPDTEVKEDTTEKDGPVITEKEDTTDEVSKEDVNFVISWLKKIIECLIKLFRGDA